MAYTVKQLAALSGVSVRLLHYYDEIDLLKPAYIGDNKYRYYQQEQLLLLQQILLYRELDFPLSDIKKIIESSNFDKLEALRSHRAALSKALNCYKRLITTIDNTIEYLEDKKEMQDNDLYYGFDSDKQKEHEKRLVEDGIVTQEFMDECNEKTKAWSDKKKNEFIQSIERIMNGLVEEIDNNSAADDKKVQELMQEHYEWLVQSWVPTKEKYLGLMDLYQTDDFRVFYDKRDPRLLDFIIAAMKVFAERQL